MQSPRTRTPLSGLRTLAGALAATAILAAAGAAQAQVAGSTRLGVGVVELRAVAEGWSVKKQALGHAVVNETGEQVGKITDIIVAPDTSVSYAIVGAGGFLGVRRHDVAIPVSWLKVSDDTVVLQGATREAIKAIPPFEYAR
jgi:sporulation protein YlmC with PRC-barrel domain